MKVIYKSIGALSICLLFSCTLHKVENAQLPDFVPSSDKPNENTAETGKNLSHAEAVQSGRPAPYDWWRHFDDPGLNTLQETLKAQNLDLLAAQARLDAALALARMTGGTQALQANITGLGSKAKTRNFGMENTDKFWRLGVSLSYEVDLWNRLSSNTRASYEEAYAVKNDMLAAYLSLSGVLARTYFGIQEQRRQLALLEDQEAVIQNFLTVIEKRFANGAASAVEVYQQRENLAGIRAQQPGVKTRLGQLQHQRDVLLGRAPTSHLTPDSKPFQKLGEGPIIHDMASALWQRPDVRAAHARVSAADYRLGAAIAARYPSLSLSASGNFEATRFAEVFNNFVWNLAGNLLAPILDGGRRKADEDRNRALVEAQLKSFQATVLSAYAEVEDARLAESQSYQSARLLQDQLKVARQAYEAGRDRYIRGVGNYITVLTSLQAVQRAERSLISAEYQVITNRIALRQAIGGQ